MARTRLDSIAISRSIRNPEFPAVLRTASGGCQGALNPGLRAQYQRAPPGAIIGRPLARTGTGLLTIRLPSNFSNLKLETGN
jgi:hypothetical protein